MSFSCYENDFNGPDVCDERIVKARKRHRCIECGEYIEIGEKHRYIRGLWDGGWGTFRTCASCQEIRDVIFPNRPYEFGDLYACLLEAEEEGKGNYDGLSPGAVEKIQVEVFDCLD